MSRGLGGRGWNSPEDEVWAQVFRVLAVGFRVEGSGLMFECLGLGVDGSGFGV
jgi:hypothetical protein